MEDIHKNTFFFFLVPKNKSWKDDMLKNAQFTNLIHITIFRIKNAQIDAKKNRLHVSDKNFRVFSKF